VDLVAGSGIDFNNHGEHALKGVPDRWQIYAVAGSQTPAQAPFPSLHAALPTSPTATLPAIGDSRRREIMGHVF
jgi:hypothetical protein